MSQKASVNRILTTLKMFNEGKNVNITDLANEFEVSERTIRRDFDIIKNTYPDFIIKKGDYYTAFHKNILEDVLVGEDLASLRSIVNIFEKTGNKTKTNPKITKLLEKSKLIYRLENKPFETIHNKPILSSLERAIEFKQYIEVEYLNNGKLTTFITKPYKIILLNENFYMACEKTEEHELELFRVNLIQNIKALPNTFYPYPALEQFILGIQTPWATFKNKRIDIKVILEVDKGISKYFKMKKYMSSQKIINHLDNENIIIEYTVSNIREITELVMKWMPSMKILEPLSLKEKIKNDLLTKLDSL